MTFQRGRLLFWVNSHLLYICLVTLLAGCASQSSKHDQNNLEYESRALR